MKIYWKFKLKTKFTYSATKASADMLVGAWYRTYNLPIITRSSNNYGPYQNKEKLIPKLFLISLGEGKYLFMEEKNVRNWIYVKDNVNAIMKVISKVRLEKFTHTKWNF